jgi:hypothetical protein
MFYCSIVVLFYCSIVLLFYCSIVLLASVRLRLFRQAQHIALHRAELAKHSVVSNVFVLQALGLQPRTPICVEFNAVKLTSLRAKAVRASCGKIVGMADGLGWWFFGSALPLTQSPQKTLAKISQRIPHPELLRHPEYLDQKCRRPLPYGDRRENSELLIEEFDCLQLAFHHL